MKKIKGCLILSICLFLIGCTYSQNMINPRGRIVRCSSYGWGVIGGIMAINIKNDCVNSYKQMGFVELEKVGVSGFYLREGNPPSVLRVQPNYPAERAGIINGDKIIAVKGQKVHSMKDVYILGFCKAGEVIDYQIDRNGELKTFSITTIPRVRNPE
jgi:membrane-associated protease RseP (regulator of RpoE activity)